MGFLTEWKIKRLKNKAARHLMAYRNEFSDMSCGAHLGKHIRGNAGHAEKFNATLDKLSKLDPSCPTKRLPTGADQ